MSRFTENKPEESVEKRILKAVDKDESDIKQFHKNHLNYLKKEYKKNGGRKRTDIYDEDFSIGIGEEDETSEGQFLDFIWDSIKRIEKMETNAMSLCDKAIICKKKAIELNLYREWDVPIKTEFCTGYGGLDGDDLNELFKKGTVTLELANDYEDYLEYHKDSDPILKDIQKYMNNNDISTFKREKDVWIHNIALYYAENGKDLLESIIFYPLNGKSPILDFAYHIITYDDLIEKINEYKKVFDEKKKSDKYLKKIFEEKEIDKTCDFNIHQYIIILASYVINKMDYSTDFRRHLPKKDHVFHPNKKKSDSKDDELNYYSIDYDTIMKFVDHIRNTTIKKRINDELVSKIIEWALQTDKNVKNLTTCEWVELIKEYYKSLGLEINKDTIIYIENPKKKEYSLNYTIIDYDDLTTENNFLFFDDEYESDSDFEP